MDTRLKVVTIMNYPPESRLQRMCYAFVDSVIAHGTQSLTVLYEEHPPVISSEHRRAIDLEVVKCRSHDIGHPHFNLRFKLANLASLDFPFLYLDADTVVIDDLNYLWSRRHAKPWVGIDHQWIPSDPRTHRPPFLNSGVQLVSDPAFYDLDAILAVQNSVAPLSRAAEFTKDQMFACPGADQAVLFRYFRGIDYDYRHLEIGPAWNSFAGVTHVKREGDQWLARTHGLDADHDVSLIHYWSQFKPWVVGCPIYASYAEREDPNPFNSEPCGL
ncbi:MAG: hypothetical protein K8U57_13905 [Planctomycetes bacterium]|nr:hypothetical protein [Planctomycetota bacterium]